MAFAACFGPPHQVAFAHDADRALLDIDDRHGTDSALQEALGEAVEIIKKKVPGNPKNKFDILGFDACFMSMGEVALEIREFADIVVSAEGMEPAFGWPYRRIFAKAKRRLAAGEGHASPKELAREIVEEYVTHYHDYDRTTGRSADLAAIDLRVQVLDLEHRRRRAAVAFTHGVSFPPLRRRSCGASL